MATSSSSSIFYQGGSRENLAKFLGLKPGTYESNWRSLHFTRMFFGMPIKMRFGFERGCLQVIFQVDSDHVRGDYSSVKSLSSKDEGGAQDWIDEHVASMIVAFKASGAFAQYKDLQAGTEKYVSRMNKILRGFQEHTKIRVIKFLGGMDKVGEINNQRIDTSTIRLAYDRAKKTSTLERVNERLVEIEYHTNEIGFDFGDIDIRVPLMLESDRSAERYLAMIVAAHDNRLAEYQARAKIMAMPLV